MESTTPTAKASSIIEGHVMREYREMEKSFQSRFFLVILLMLPIVGASPTFQSWFGVSFSIFPDHQKYVLLGCITLIVFVGGFPFFRGAFREMSDGRYSTMTLASVALSMGWILTLAGAFDVIIVDFYLQLTTLVLSLLFGYWITTKIIRASFFGVQRLVGIFPDEVQLVKKGGDDITVAIEDVKVGERIRVMPGGIVPLDGVIENGQTDIDVSNVMGKSDSYLLKPGDEVVAGMRVIDNAITVSVTRLKDDTMLSHIIEVLRRSQELKPDMQETAEHLAKYLTLLIIVIAGGTFFYWQFIGGDSFLFSYLVVMAILVVSSPFAFEIAVPVVTAMLSSVSIEKGIILKDANIVEKAQNIEYVMFDKTGILTEGEFKVTDIIPLSKKHDEKAVLRIAASLEVASLHPVAVAVVKEAMRRSLSYGEAEKIEFISGKGVAGKVMGEKALVGSDTLMREKKIDVDTYAKELESLNIKKRNVVWVASDGKVIGLIGCADEIREGAKETIQELKDLDITPIMLTGDGQEVAEWVAHTLGIERYHAQVLPEDKAKIVSVLHKEIYQRTDGNDDGVIAMVGDGVNDAEAIKAADIGIALGADTNIDLEVADIIFMKRDLRDISSLVRLSHNAASKVNQNVFFAFIYNLFAIPLAAGVFMTWGISIRPDIGALLMSVGAILITLNALTLRRTK
jgi:Cu2+-exporting ATPase